MKTAAIVIVLVLSAAGASADIFSWMDGDGVRHWSNADPKNPAGPVERTYEFPATIELPQKTPSYSPVYVPSWYGATPARSHRHLDRGFYRATSKMMKAEPQLLENRRERLENAYWRNRDRLNGRNMRGVDSDAYRAVKGRIEERQEELESSPKRYFQERKLRGRR